jgi:hypothetical protein
MTNITTFRQDDLELVGDGSQPWRKIKGVVNVLELSSGNSSLSMKLIKAEDLLEYSPCEQKISDMGDSTISASNETKFRDVNLLLPTRSLECSVFTTRYDVKISFANGVQSVEYSTAGKQPYSTPLESYPFPSPQFKPFQSLGDYFQTSALVEAFLFQLDFHDIGIHYIPTIRWVNEPEVKKIRLLNGSDITIEVCKVDLENCPTYESFFSATSNDTSYLKLSAFGNRRNQTGTPCLDEFSFTEALLNKALANLTISALSLNYWYNSVNGTTDKHFNLYQFTNKTNFFLPYGLTLLFAIPIIALGIMALHENGVSAIDGGFVQLLVTTTGRTELERHATKACLGGYENFSKELKELKVRFGELLTDGDGGEKGEEAAEREVGEESSIQQESGHGEVYDSVRQSEEQYYSTSASSVKMPTATPGLVHRSVKRSKKNTLTFSTAALSCAKECYYKQVKK